ncbi:MAG TPA: type II toxin-antitoxin system VapB family antitoxin [Nitrospirota bacterium]|nr:type II toxin-antitoxin system VapB family antitoxin [Nitrospirota bacterium]
MRATLNIPDDLISEAQKATGEKSKTKAITAAIQEFLRQKKLRDLLALRGKVKIDYDWRKEEERELKAQQKREKLLERKK